MTIPSLPATTTASDVYQLKSPWIRTCAKFMGLVQIAAYVYLIYATVVALTYMSVDLDGRHRQQPADALGVLLTINGCMFVIGMLFGFIFSLGAHFGDMCVFGLYNFFAIFSMLFHLNAFFAFLILKAWMFVGLSVLPLAMHVVGLCFVVGIFGELEEMEKLLVQHRRNQQEQPPPPSYSSCVDQQA